LRIDEHDRHAPGLRRCDAGGQVGAERLGIDAVDRVVGADLPDDEIGMSGDHVGVDPLERRARDLAADIRLPWQQPCQPGRLTPARVRRGFRRIRQALPVPASAPKTSRPGPGRPAASKNQWPATRHDAGKTVKREEPKKKTRRQTG